MACRSNNSPVVPAKFFVNSVKEFGFCPKLLRTDAGTENGLMAAIQCILRQNITSHKYGSSIANQRIENWWSSMRRCFSGWLIDFFKEKVSEGRFVTGSILHKDIAWFSFANLIQTELSQLKRRWNTHRIRKSHEDVVAGIPNQLYYIPEYFGFENCGFETSEEVIENIDGIEHIEENWVGDADLDHNTVRYFRSILERNNLYWPPVNWQDAVHIFDVLLTQAVNLI